MGQAKQRGTFEQRQAEGIVKREKEQLEWGARVRELRTKPNSSMATLLAASMMATVLTGDKQ